MKLRDRFSNAVYGFLEKRGWIEDIYGNSTRYSQRYVNDSSIMESSDVYELVQDISNQVALAEPVVIGPGWRRSKKSFLVKYIKKTEQLSNWF